MSNKEFYQNFSNRLYNDARAEREHNFDIGFILGLSRGGSSAERTSVGGAHIVAKPRRPSEDRVHGSEYHSDPKNYYCQSIQPINSLYIIYILIYY
jgi:hypothetical protein